MILFSQEIYKLVNCALTELNTSQASGRTQSNQLSESHYIGAWITTAIKKKRFDTIVLETLKGWQKQARSLNKNAGLKEKFVALEKCYKQVLDTDNQVQPVSIDQLNTLYTQLTEQQWMVTTDLVIGDRLNRLSGGLSSLIVCAEKMNSCFEQGILIKPLTLYIRGDLQELVELAFKQDLLLYKKTTNKSKVKYHGEFIVYPNNDGTALPMLPTE